MFFNDAAHDLVTPRCSALEVVIDSLQNSCVHGDAVTFGSGTKLGGLFVRQPEGHGHGSMIPGWYQRTRVNRCSTHATGMLSSMVVTNNPAVLPV